MNADLVTWHLDIDTSGAALQRFAHALLSTGGSLLPSRLIMGEMGRGVTAMVVVQLPAGQDKKFKELCKPQLMKPPPKVNWGMGVSGFRAKPRHNLAATSNQPPASESDDG
jgi:hypothetical protein